MHLYVNISSSAACRTPATTYKLLHARGKDRYKANELLASKIQTLQQQLDYEAIIQIAEIDDKDLLYLNFDNQALGETHSFLILFPLCRPILSEHC